MAPAIQLLAAVFALMVTVAPNVTLYAGMTRQEESSTALAKENCLAAAQARTSTRTKKHFDQMK
jgi:hypothetical protein